MIMVMVKDAHVYDIHKGNFVWSISIDLYKEGPYKF